MDVSRRARYSRGVVALMVAAFGALPATMIAQDSANRGAVANASAELRARQPVTVDVDRTPLSDVLVLLTRQAGLTPAYDGTVLPHNRPVTLHLHNVPIIEALQAALEGTGFVPKIHASGYVVLTRSAGGAAVQEQGILAGTVVDAGTKRPLRGVTITLDDVTRGVQTDENGTYRIVGVTDGTHRVSTRFLGYARQSHTVTIANGVSTSADFALTASATALDQVVVTGTVIPTELKAIPNAITVITAKQIEERGITKIDQLFRGDIPGLFAQNQGSLAPLDGVTMFSRGVTALSGASAGTSLGTNPIKTYIDGIELADPQYLSQIDPKSIERIEILTGPQASTIYGSNAINGVMQVFTKRGTSNTPQLTLNLLSGFVQNNFSSALTPQHDYSASVNGLEGRFSYNAGASWNYMGAWTPAKQMARLGGFGGARLELPTLVGRVSTDMTLRRTLTQSLQRGDAQQTFTSYRESGWYRNTSSFSGFNPPTLSTLTGQTLGFTLSYVPIFWWSHELGLGSDASDTETRRTARGYRSLSDTTFRLEQTHTDRRSMRYATTARMPVTALAQVAVTVGADAWQNLTSSLAVFPQTLAGTLTGSTTVSRQPGHNTGGFVQAQVDVIDRLFFTYGLRLEKNPTIGDNARVLPGRYGMAYTQEFGALTAKVRGSYGRSIRPPAPTLKDAVPQTDASAIAFYGNFDLILANPDLTPEYQQGGEGGFELYVGTRGSLVITRYNQTVNNLIASVTVDSVRSLESLMNLGLDPTFYPYWSDGYVHYGQIQYLNIGSIRNQGWELQGNVNTGPFTTRGTYSWTKSRVIGITPKYRALFVNNVQYQPGATFQFLPEHTWMLGVTYVRAGSSVGFNITGVGRVRNGNDGFFAQNFRSDIRLPQNRLNVSNTGGYIDFNAGYALADLEASHRLGSHLEALLQVQNLANRYTNDYDAFYASLGRQVKVGARLR